MARILVVEDDLSLSDSIVEYLESEHHTVELTGDGKSGALFLKTYTFDVVIMDVGLPDTTGIAILKEYRASGGKTPVLILTGKDKIHEKVEGFEAGADDYLTKPFDLKELSVRVRALLRRPAELKNDELSLGNITLSVKNHSLIRGSEQVKLTPKEFALLEFFLRHPGQVFSSEALIERVWHSDVDAAPDAVKVAIARLRTKIGSEPGTPQIKTVFGVGYKIEESSS